jgi:hypothetical protein
MIVIQPARRVRNRDESSSRNVRRMMHPMPAVVILAVSIAAFAGCVGTTGPIAGPGGDAEYRHPATGDTRHCVNNTGQGFLFLGAFGALAEGSRYADCKSALEAQGYLRFKPGSVILRHPGTGHLVDCSVEAQSRSVQPAIGLNNCVVTHQKLGYVSFADSFPAPQVERAIAVEPGKDCPPDFERSPGGQWCLPK